MEKILVREMVFKYGIKDMMNKTMYPEVVEEILERKNISLDNLLKQSLGYTQEEIDSIGEVETYRNIKNIVATANLIQEGLKTYEEDKWNSICEGVRSGDPSHYKSIFVPYISKKIRVTSRHKSIVTEDGKVHLSNRMIKKTSLNLLVACVHVQILGLSFHRMFLKKSIENMRLFKTGMLKPMLDKNLTLLIMIAEYWGITMNELMDWDFNPDEFIGVNLVVVPTDNIGIVSIRDYTKRSRDVEVSEEALSIIIDRGLLKEFNRRDNIMYIGDTRLEEYWR